ncbi:MAG: hypothetical protein PHI05_04160 [Bacilli bacterium]|nr:hypothetical protein [Bacilli bacterium]MDD4547915.1 hypothetical protein [Bacilli bacterium]
MKLDERVDRYLSDNAMFIDKLYLMKVNIRLKKLFRKEIPFIDLDTLSWQVNYMLEKQKGDSNDVLSLLDYIEKLSRQKDIEYANYLRTGLNLYVRELHQGLVTSKMYITDQNDRLKQVAALDERYAMPFEDVLTTREKINEKQLVLMKKDRGV